MLDLKMIHVKLHSDAPQTFMVYAVSKPQAQKLFNEKYMTYEVASALQIAEHVRAGKPILGEPTPPDPNQAPPPAAGE